MGKEFTAFVDSLNRVASCTFRDLKSERPCEALRAALQISFAATSPNQVISNSVCDHVSLIPLIMGLSHPKLGISKATLRAIYNIACRFGAEHGFTQAQIKDNPLEVCEAIIEKRSIRQKKEAEIQGLPLFARTLMP